MKTPSDVKALFERVQSLSDAERERIYRRHFAAPSQTVRYLCEVEGLDRKAVLDVCCHYGYHLMYFGEGSQGIDASERYLRVGREIGLTVHQANIEDGLPDVGRFDAILFSGTMEEVLSPHVVLMRFRKHLKPGGMLYLRVPIVPPGWFDRLYQRFRGEPGYAAALHLYFFKPDLLRMTLERAGYAVEKIVSTGVWMQPALRPFHRWLMPLSPMIMIHARMRDDFKYPSGRTKAFLPAWAADLAPYHTDDNS